MTFYFGPNSTEVFRIYFDKESNVVTSVLAEDAKMDDVTKIFFDCLKLDGQTLMDLKAAEEQKIERLIDLANEFSNDMEFGSRARRLLYEYRTNRP
jgi:hypothetical protein